MFSRNVRADGKLNVPEVLWRGILLFGHPTGLGKHLAGLGYRSNSASLYRGKGRSWRFEDWLVRETNLWQERSQINNWGDKGGIEEEQNENTKTRKTRSLENGTWVHPSLV